MSEMEIKDYINNCQARNEILLDLGWQGVNFCTWIPMKVRKRDPDLWKAIRSDIFRPGKEKLDGLVREKCVQWVQLFVVRLKRMHEEMTNQWILSPQLPAVSNDHGNKRIDRVLTEEELAIIRETTVAYTPKIMDYLGDRIAMDFTDRTKTFFLSEERYQNLRKEMNQLPDLDPLDIYETIFREKFPRSTVMTVFFFLSVSDNLAQTHSSSVRWITVTFRVREARAVVRDTSGATDVFTGRNGARNQKLLLERTGVIFNLCGIETVELEIKFIKGLIHRTHVDTGPLSLEEMSENSSDAEKPSRSMKMVTFQRMEDLRERFHQLVKISTVNSLKFIGYHMQCGNKKRRRNE